MKYLDFGTPISFGYTAQYLPEKCVTRRDWKDSHAAKFIKAWSRAVTEDRQLRIPAIDKGYHAGGKQIGWLTLDEPLYKEALKNMQQSELLLEGGMCNTRREFIDKYFKGDTEKEVWVIRFKFHQLDDKSHTPEPDEALGALMTASNSAAKSEPIQNHPMKRLLDEVIIDNKKYNLHSQPHIEIKKNDLVFLEGEKIGRIQSVHGRHSVARDDLSITYIERGCKKKETVKAMTKIGYQFFYLSYQRTEEYPPKALGVLTSSKTDEHYTPQNIIEAAREVMGTIDLDPMSCAEANERVGSAKFYDKNDNGLTKTWSGRVWLNPAFSLADDAVKNLLQAYLAGTVTEALLLIKAAPDTNRHQMLSALPFCEIKGRVKFIADSNNHPAPFAILVFYLGKNFPKFREVFSKFGNIRLGQTQVDELENDRRELLAKVAELQLQLAKKSEVGTPDQRMDWMEDDICDRTAEAENRLKAFDIDCNIPHLEILSRQRIEWTAKLELLKSLQKSANAINTAFFGGSQTERPPRPQIEEMEGWRSEFAVNKLIECGDLVASIKQYSRIRGEWIAFCQIRARAPASRADREVLVNAIRIFGGAFAPFSLTSTAHE